MKNLTAKYKIRVKTYYYNVQKDTHWLTTDHQLPDGSYEHAEFDNKQAAHDYLVNDLDLSKNADGSYSCDGIYCTNHNEYARPDYFIRKVK